MSMAASSSSSFASSLAAPTPSPPSSAPAPTWRSRSGSVSTMNGSASSSGVASGATGAGAVTVISPRTSSLSHDNPATFIGPSAELFDVNYIRADRNFGDVHPSSLSSQPRTIVEDEDYASSLKEILPPFPSPDPLTSYWEYELELISWRSSVERAVGYIKLPTLVGRHLYRPQTDSGAVTAMTSASSSSSSTQPSTSLTSTPTSASVSPNTNASSPSNSSFNAFGGRRISVDSPGAGVNLNSFRNSFAPPTLGAPLSSPRSLSQLLEQEDDDSSPSESNIISGSAGSSAGGSSDNTSLVMGSMGSSSSNNSAADASSVSEDPWDTLLVPAEPNPTQFSSFDDYYVAMVRWANACQLSYGYAIPTACNALPSLLPLHRTTKSRANSSAQSSFVPPTLRKRGWASAESLLFGGEYQGTPQQQQHQMQPPVQLGLPFPPERSPAGLGAAPVQSLNSDVWGNGCIFAANSSFKVSPDQSVIGQLPTRSLPSSSSKSSAKILKGMEKMTKRARIHFHSTGRTSAPLRALPGASLPEEEARSPLFLLQNPGSVDTVPKRDGGSSAIYSATKRRRRNTASFENAVVDQWPSASQSDPVTRVCESLRTVLVCSTMSVEWQRARIQLPWVGNGDPPFPPHGPVLTISDLCLHLVDSLFVSKDDESSCFRVCSVFSQLRAETRSVEIFLACASLLSMLIRASSTFVGMISSCVKAAKLLTTGHRLHQQPTALEILRDLSFFLSLIQSSDLQDVFWFPEDLFDMLKHVDPSSGAAKLVQQSLGIFYVELLDRFTESELRRHMQVDRIEAATSLCFFSRGWLKSSITEFVASASSPAAVKLLSVLLSHRSSKLAFVGYLVLSTVIKSDRTFKASPTFMQLARSLHVKKRHVRWIHRRVGSLLLASTVQQFPSLCSSLATTEIAADICYPKSASQLLWWDRVYMKLASEGADSNVCQQFPSLFHASVADAVLDRICSTKIRLEAGGSGLEFERCFLSARLLNLQSSIFSTICYVLAKNQAVSMTPKLKDDAVFKLSYLALVKLLQFVQSPHAAIPVTSPAGRQHAAARASVALAVCYLFGERSVVSALTKWWKKSPRGLIKLVEKAGAPMKSSARFKSLTHIPASPLLAVAYILVGMIKQSTFYDYAFGSTILHCLNCLLISHPRVASYFTEVPRVLKPSQSLAEPGEDPAQPLLLQLIEGFALNSGATTNLPSVAHFCRAITLLFSGVVFDKDVKTIAEYLLKHHHYIKINLAVRKVQDLVPGILFVVIKELTTTLASNPNASKLVKSIDASENMLI
eukprot:TRINITY_DN3516_c0_g1_i1.p1 TRINITY_DN3516_c0_g1~~TRINITY_DN3516_c0_g1_i1.p1  ORF type:complete len:1286 (+),score=175.81 TRINITY_DN3516_c0_g1_i1:3507-7364(+)